MELTAMSIPQDSGRNCWLLVSICKNVAQVGEKASPLFLNKRM